MGDLAMSILEVRGLACRRGAVGIRAEHLCFGRDTLHLLTGERDSGHELLVRVLGLLERPEAGEVLLEGAAVGDLADDARLRLRERRLGLVFASPFLLPAFSVVENVAMPLFKLTEVDPIAAGQRSLAVLDFVGLAEVASVPCADLSIFDQHRASLARALVNAPAALLVEDLGGALASEDLRAFATLLRKAAARFGVAVIAAGSREFPVEAGDRLFEVHHGVAVAVENRGIPSQS